MIIGFNTPLPKIDRLDKDTIFEGYLASMFNRLLMMFEYKNLPPQLEKINIEKQLLYYGHLLIFEHSGKYYSLTGGLGGEPNAYFMPTLYTIANPYLRISKSFTIGDKCVLVGNDSMYYGLKNMMVRYATQLTENVISLTNMDILNRAPVGLATPDDNTYKSAMKFLNDVYLGKLSAMADNAFLDGIKVLSLHSQGGSHLTDEIELHQYLKASWFNEIGLKSNYNMKRESINSDEAQLDNTSLLPLAYDMLNMRKEAFDKFNEMFSENVVVEFSDIWKKSEEFLNSNTLENSEDDEEISNTLENSEDENDSI